jgi:Arc/MetJ-type ribon-helix-helix transcriptional regulator
MAEVQQQQILPAPFIQAAAEQYFPQLAQAVGGIKGLDVSRLVGPQFVAGASPLQQQAEQLATGLGGYQPFLQAAQAATGPQAYQAYMSPYQQQVIDTTLRQYDIQAAKGLPALAAQAIGYGAFGGGREGIQRAEYQTQSDLNRALLQAQLQQQGLTQAQQQAQQNYLNQLNLAGQTQGFLGQQISGLSALGAQQQAQQQALLSAQQQLAQKQAYQPLEAAQIYGAGIAPLIAGYPGRESVTQFPSPTGLQTALGVAGTLASIYGKLNPPQSPAPVINVGFPRP